MHPTHGVQCDPGVLQFVPSPKSRRKEARRDQDLILRVQDLPARVRVPPRCWCTRGGAGRRGEESGTAAPLPPAVDGTAG